MTRVFDETIRILISLKNNIKLMSVFYIFTFPSVSEIELRACIEISMKKIGYLQMNVNNHNTFGL